MDEPDSANVEAGLTPTGVSDKVFAPPAMSSRGVSLRPMRQADYEFVRFAESSGELAARWRFGGATPGPEEWLQRSGAGVLAQYLVFTSPADPPVGLVTAYEANMLQGHAKLAAARFGDDERSPAVVIGLALLVRHVFACWRFRKLYLDVPEFNLPQFQSAIGRYFQEEGRLIDHLYFGDQWWDQVTLALYRARWREAEARLLPSGA